MNHLKKKGYDIFHASNTKSHILTFSVQLLSILTMLRQTDITDIAGVQSSVKIDKHICPLL